MTKDKFASFTDEDKATLVLSASDPDADESSRAASLSELNTSGARRGGVEPAKVVRVNQDDFVMTPPEAARYLRISVATLLRGSRRDEIPAFQVGNKLWRYKKSVLDDWLHSKVSSFRHPCRK
jgi:excisionase family DNA binding protein